MRRFGLGVSVVFVLLASAVGVSIFAGQRQAPSSALQRFHLDGCVAPCVMGTTLGKTTYNEVLNLFRERQNEPDALIFDQILPDSITLRMMGNNGKVIANEIVISFANGIVDSVKISGIYGPGSGIIPTLGDLVSIYGSPQCAQSSPRRDSSFGNITILNPRLGVQVVISGWYEMDWTTPVGSFIVSHYVESNDATSAPCKHRWHGTHHPITASMIGARLTV